MTFLIPYCMVFLAAVFNALMDRVENEPAFNKSIFRKLDVRFWSKVQSAKYVSKIFGYRPDAWHLAKSCMIICFAFAIVFFIRKHEWWVHIVSIGLIWNLTFPLFYHKVFFKK